MRNTFYLFSILNLSILLISCTKQPSCSDEKTIQNVNELVEKLIVTELAYEDFLEEIRFDEQQLRLLNLAAITRGQSSDDILEEIKEKIRIYIVEEDPSDHNIEKYVVNAFNEYKDLEPKLINIRVAKIDKELRKCDCQAELKLKDGRKFDINFTSQLDEKDDNYVEVSIIN